MLNTQTTWNRFYISKKDAQSPVINNLGGESWQYQDLQEVDRVKVEKPMLIDAGTIHDVWCEPGTSFPRLGLQMQLINEPKFL